MKTYTKHRKYLDSKVSFADENVGQQNGKPKASARHSFMSFMTKIFGRKKKRDPISDRKIKSDITLETKKEGLSKAKAFSAPDVSAEFTNEIDLAEQPGTVKSKIWL